MSVFDTAADLWGLRTAFRGADAHRLYADRWIQTNHPDTELHYSLRQLRASSRDLRRNNPYAAGLIEAVADNVTGWEGMQLRPMPAEPDGELPREVKWRIQAAWTAWCDDYATVDGVDSWLEAERLIDCAWATDGEVFIRRHRGWDNPHGFAAELIDPDLLDEEYNVPRDRSRTGNEIVMGVEVDEWGRPLAYHFWTEHPDEIGFRRQRTAVPADEIAHYFVRQRPGQTRGYPMLTPALTRFEMADGYEEAELVAARYHASKMGFITNNEPAGIEAYAAHLAMQASQGKGEVRKRHKMSPGLIPELAPGQGFQSFDPTHPSDSVEPFLKQILRGIARAGSMSYLTLTGDVAEANYSSMRAGLIPERDHWKVVQNVKARRVHRVVHTDWRAMAMLSGALRIPRQHRDYRATFRGRRWQWVDPMKDLDAAEGEIKLGIASRQEKAADRGRDYETVVDESAEDMEYAKDAGVYVGGLNTPAVRRSTDGASANGNGSGNRAGASSRSSRLAPYTGE